ncbi:MAG: hypothetical protein K9J79_10540 [Desulfobacteraceae bacterium]|nr:hypothetical protein [Desulfobacteraceae bacterium]
MTYKRIEASFSFADIAVEKYADKNRSMQFLSQIEKNHQLDADPGSSDKLLRCRQSQGG